MFYPRRLFDDDPMPMSITKSVKRMRTDVETYVRLGITFGDQG